MALSEDFILAGVQLGLMEPQSSYVPGVCNINPKETAQRRLIGHIGLAIFVVLLIALLFMDVTRFIRIILFLPAALSASGYLQAKNHFCVGYGGAGLQNATAGSENASAVTDTAAVAADKKRSRQMNLQAAGIALIVTIIAIAIPHL